MSLPHREVVQETSMPMATITRTPINTAGPGPFYVYSPGLTFVGLRGMVYLFNNIPAGEVFRIESGPTTSNKHQLPEGVGNTEIVVKNWFGQIIDRLIEREIPAQDTLQALLSDPSLLQYGLTQITVLDFQDAYPEYLNMLIRPEEIADRKIPVNSPYKQMIESEGMLAVRKLWLEKAAEGLRTGRVLEDVYKVLESKPYLGEIWAEAVDFMITSVNEFVPVANTVLAKKEEDVKSGALLEYDGLSHLLMWLLGRKPERTALSRTFENFSKSGGAAGISAEQLTEILKATTGQGVQTQAALPAMVYETMQCQNCGTEINMINGGPPPQCWRCQFKYMDTVSGVYTNGTAQQQRETTEVITPAMTLESSVELVEETPAETKPAEVKPAGPKTAAEQMADDLMKS